MRIGLPILRNARSLVRDAS